MDPDAYREVACIEPPISPECVIEAAYWEANPDIAAIGMPAAEHYRQYGCRENRKQAINQAEVKAIRERKLQRVRFRRPPNAGRKAGEPADFLSDDLRREFRIPRHPPVSSNDYGPFIADMQRERPASLFLDVGCGLRSTVSSNMVNMDVFAAVSTDVIAVGEDMPFEDDQFDFILCAAVLEHTRRPRDVAREMCRVVKPGGMVRIDYPFLQPVHGYPSHYFNATPEGAISLFEDYCDIDYSIVETNNHPIQALRWIIDLWQEGLNDSDRAAFEAMSLGQILARPAQEHLADGFCRNLDPQTQRLIAAGSTLVAIKKPGVRGAPGRNGRDTVAENAALHAALRTMRASTSWKLTAPMRWILSTLRGRLGHVANR
jgi:SAM-dependent methyltransferase